MNIINNITFRFTLWYLAIFSILLLFLAGLVYGTLYQVLYRNLDQVLIKRAKQLENFRGIMSIVAGGTFEEEPEECIVFYYYHNQKLHDIRHKKLRASIDIQRIKNAINGKSSFLTIKVSPEIKLRTYITPFHPDQSDSRPQKKRPLERPQSRNTLMNQVSLSEFLNNEKRVFGIKDLDGNGEISRHEYAEDEKRKSHGRYPPRDRFNEIDEDHNNIISLKEYLNDEHRRFQQMDRNNDDQLSRQEMHRRPPPRHERRQRPHPNNNLQNNRGSIWQTSELDKVALLIARPTGHIEMALKRLLQILLFAIPFTIFISTAGGLFLARRALKPVDEMTRIAREIGENDLSRRIEIRTKDELGRLAMTLNQMIERLEQAFERQKQFTGDASHELRAPLSVIQAESTLALQKERPAREYLKTIETIAQECDHMSGIIKQLLFLARADSGKEYIVFKSFNLTEFICDFCVDARILCKEKSIHLELVKEENIFVNAHDRSIKRLMYNLLGNAIRYTKANGKVTIKVQKKEPWVEISVSDTGIGIPEKDIPYIFDRFYRVDKARSRREGGSGLGLAICNQIVDMHGGEIEVKSQPEKGSTFIVKLFMNKFTTLTGVPNL
jgi:heavy metal sensor kinase